MAPTREREKGKLKNDVSIDGRSGGFPLSSPPPEPSLLAPHKIQNRKLKNKKQKIVRKSERTSLSLSFSLPFARSFATNILSLSFYLSYQANL